MSVPSTGTNDCAARNANCRNNVGSYTCECKEGKELQISFYSLSFTLLTVVYVKFRQAGTVYSVHRR